MKIWVKYPDGTTYADIFLRHHQINLSEARKMKILVLNKDYAVFSSYKHETNNWIPVKNFISFNPFFKVNSAQMRLNTLVRICGYYSALFCLTAYPFVRPSINLL